MNKIAGLCIEFFWKSVLIGALYVMAMILTGGALIKLGLKFPEAANNYNFILCIMFISGFIISVAGGIIVKYLRLTKPEVFGALYLVFFLNSVTQLLEALYFAPGIVNWKVAPAIYGQQFITYIFVSAGITLLFNYEGKNDFDLHIRYINIIGYIWRILASSACYVAFYFLFGSINAKLFTGDYYRAQIGGLSLPDTKVILVLEAVRAVILVLSILPLVINLRVSKGNRAAIVGMVLFVIGGLLPMLQQLGSLPTTLVVASTVEMFFQFFLTGICATYILLYENIDKRSLRL